MNAPLHDHRFCPSCGFDIALDAPIMIDKWSMFGIGYPLCYEGKPIRMTGGEAAVCWALMKAYPRPVRIDVLLNRMGSESPGNVVQVMVCRIRKYMRELDLPCPIKNMRGSYVWLAEVAQ